MLREWATPQQIDDLQGEHLDLRFLRSHTPPNLPPGLEASEIVKEKLYVILPTQHPLAATTAPLKTEALAEEAFVFFAREVRSTLHDQVYALCAASGFARTIAMSAARARSRWLDIFSPFCDRDQPLLEIGKLSSRALCTRRARRQEEGEQGERHDDRADHRPPRRQSLRGAVRGGQDCGAGRRVARA